MPKNWVKDIEAVVQQGEDRVKEVECLRLKREDARKKSVDAAKDVIRDCLNESIKVMQKYGVAATLIEDETSIFLKMPELSEVNRADLIFEFESIQAPDQTEAKTSIHAMRVEANAPVKASGCEPGGDIEEFTAKALRDFLEGWYKRKLSDELNKEREWKIKISFAPLQGKGDK
jgi:hypothetical protein